MFKGFRRLSAVFKFFSKPVFYPDKDAVWHEVGVTKRGYTVYRVPNHAIGGWDYVSDSLGGGYIVIYSCTSTEELELILEDMKKRQ